GRGCRPRRDVGRGGGGPASAYYGRSKERLAAKVGVASRTHVLPEGTAEDSVMALVAGLNADADVDGILVQLPLPGIDEKVVLDAIDPAKDVDGLHPTNVGRLWSGRDALVPATPLGIMALCDHYGIDPEGTNVVIVGRSNLVGKPLAALFLGRNATVTVAHSRTRDLAEVTRRADILVAAVGKARFVRPEMVRPGAVVFDVGVTREDGVVVGDVD